MDAYLISLCREYTQIIDQLRTDSTLSYAARQALDSERLILHDQLNQHLGLDRQTDMYRRARAILMAAKAGGHQ